MPVGDFECRVRVAERTRFTLCSFSGLNDTPDGIPGIDPGGIAQSFGFFMAQYGLYDPADPDQRDSFLFPANGCNPTVRGGRH